MDLFFCRLCDLDPSAMQWLSAAAASHFMKKCSDQRSAPSCNRLVSHAILKTERKLINEIEWSESNIGDFICSCRRPAHFEMLLATSSS